MARYGEERRGVERRKRIMAFVREYIAANGFAPSIREIADACDISSTSVVNHHLRKLADAGQLRKTANTSRALVLVDDIT